jgi:hypothetical protein
VIIEHKKLLPTQSVSVGVISSEISQALSSPHGERANPIANHRLEFMRCSIIAQHIFATFFRRARFEIKPVNQSSDDMPLIEKIKLNHPGRKCTGLFWMANNAVYQSPWPSTPPRLALPTIFW